MWHVCVRYIWHDSSIYTTRRVLVRFSTFIYLWDILNIWVESCHIYVIYMSWVRSKISSDRVVSYIWTSHVTHTWNVQLCHVIHMSWVIWLESESIMSYLIWVIYVIWVLQRISVSSLSALQCVAVCCSVLQSVAAYFSVIPKCVSVCCSVLQSVAAISVSSLSALQCVAVCCSVLQCVAECCSVFQCFP